jgi:hypothetical protein
MRLLQTQAVRWVSLVPPSSPLAVNRRSDGWPRRLEILWLASPLANGGAIFPATRIKRQVQTSLTSGAMGRLED